MQSSCAAPGSVQTRADLCVCQKERGFTITAAFSKHSSDPSAHPHRGFCALQRITPLAEDQQKEE